MVKQRERELIPVSSAPLINIPGFFSYLGHSIMRSGSTVHGLQKTWQPLNSSARDIAVSITRINAESGNGRSRLTYVFCDLVPLRD